MKLRLLDIKIKGKFEGRPSRKQVEVEDWEGPLISPSALTSYLACPRKWAFGALDNQYLPSTASQSLGQKLHSELEDWLTKGKPTLGRLSDSGALSLVPVPTTPGLECEQPFAVEVSDGSRRAVLWGFRDVAYPGGVMDLKTTSSLDWAKTPEELTKDPQANIYAAASILESGLEHADLRWVYVTTRGAIASKSVDVRLTRAQVTATLQSWFDSICYMSELREAKTKRALELEPLRTACGDYGGCGYLPNCGEVPAGGGFLSLRKQAKNKQARHEARGEEMKILDKIKKDMGTWKTDEMVAQATSVPVRPSPVVENEPKKNPLKQVIVKSRLAEGINAPDARPVEDVPVEEPKKKGRPKALAKKEKKEEAPAPAPAPAPSPRVEGKWSSLAENLVLLVNVTTKRSADLPYAVAPDLREHLLKNYPKCQAYLAGSGSFDDAESEVNAKPLVGVFFVERSLQTNQLIRSLLLKADWVLEGV